ncbi:hypothetical protein ACFY3U_04235 [Micromonospora sp. NPDC000089]|uniref:hypothetical protein n=1 Tax=unclassified Micromonospora TaxID=2617518 RepID=UPI0036BF3DD6
MRRLSPDGRRALLTLHLVTSLGWLGADLGLLTLGVAGLRGADPAVVYPAAALLATWLFAPLSVAVWLAGVASALLTPWGLLRHRWVVVKLGLTSVMLVLVLFLLVPTVRAAALPDATAHQRIDVVVAPSVSTALLVTMTVISTWKPWGRTRRGVPARRPASTAATRG